jgi:predicted nucleic acid-binding protein
MIVVDSNVIAYLYLPTPFTALAERLLERRSPWVAPVLWRSEIRNVLAQYLRRKSLTLTQALEIQEEAEGLLAGREFDVPSLEVLRLVERSGCSAYDCEFVALAIKLDVPLVTVDKKILSEFPAIAVPLDVACGV